VRPVSCGPVCAANFDDRPNQGDPSHECALEESVARGDAGRVGSCVASTSNGRERTYRNRVAHSHRSDRFSRKSVCGSCAYHAGYAANGKYSHYLLAQTPVRIGADIVLPSGAYAVGWTRSPDGLLVHIYNAETGAELGTITAHPAAQPIPIVSIKIWPPRERSVIQIGRFLLPYSLDE